MPVGLTSNSETVVPLTVAVSPVKPDTAAAAPPPTGVAVVIRLLNVHVPPTSEYFSMPLAAVLLAMYNVSNPATAAVRSARKKL